MIRIRHLLLLGLALIAANERAVSVAAVSRPVRPAQSIQVILRLTAPPLSAIAPVRLRGVHRTAPSRSAALKEQEYNRTLAVRQQDLVGRLNRMGVRVVARYRLAFNGLCVETPPSMLPQLSRLPGVAHVSRVQPVFRNNSATAPFIGASTVWSRLGVRGNGVRVAVIDSGIDYTHRAFGGPGTAAAFEANNPTVIEPGTFPTAKVVGGYDLVGDDFPSTGPRPDPDPLDPASNGHGTRIAGIIAGQAVPGQLASGIAPGVLLLAYKIYGRSGASTQNIVLQALERAMDPNGDGSLSDRADVINISGGTSRQSAGDPLVVAADYAARLGTIIVGSAGNDGDNPYFVGGPGVAAGAISVGNSYGGGPIYNAVRVNTPALGNLVAAEGALTAPLTPAGVTADLVYVGTASVGASLLTTPQGRIALVDRDGRPYVDKVRACQQAGAVGIVIVNNSGSAPISMPGDRSGITIPGVMISRDDGARLKAALAAGQRVNVTLSSQGQLELPSWADRIDDASSRGPRRGDSLIKPDVVAPGVNLVAAAAGTGERGTPDTGTSAAAPVVAGIAALLRQVHPTWSVAEIKAAIVNTAQPLTANGQPYPISRQGAGRVRADAALMTQVVAIADDDTPALSFGVVEEVDRPALRRLYLSNKGTRPRQYAVRVDYLTPADAAGGIELTVTRGEEPVSRVALPAGDTLDLNLTLTIHPEKLSPANREYDGYVIFSDVSGDGTTLRVPFLAILRSASLAEVSTVSENSLLLKNSNPAVPAQAQLFAWVIDDPHDLDTEGDIRALGARSLIGPTPATTRIELAVSTHRPWSTPFGPQFILFLDRDEDGRADLTLTNDDAGLLTGGPRSGVPAAVLREATSGRVIAGSAAVRVGAHSGVIVFSISAAQLGLDPSARLTVWAQGGDPWRSERQWDRTARGSFDPFRPGLAASPPDVHFDRSASVELIGDPSVVEGMLILYPSNSRGLQAQTVSLRDATITSRRGTKR